MVTLVLLLLLGPLVRLESAIVRIQILQTTDLHGYVEKSDKLEDGGGMLRIATALKQRRQAFGPKRTLLIDSGDTVQGTWEAALTRGQVGIEFLKYMDYDVWAPGNHELDYGVKRLHAFCRETKDFVTAANLGITTAEGEYRPPPWRLFKRGPARIAVIGATSSAMDAWFWGKQFEGYTVQKAYDVLPKVLARVLVMKPDMVILAAHQGWLPNESRGLNEVKKIAEEYPEIDLILGGHTHWPHAGKTIGPNTWYMQAGRDADMIGVVFAEIDTDKDRVLDISSRLVKVTRSVADKDPVLNKRLDKWMQHARREGRKVVGHTNTGISSKGRLGKDCEKFELLCRALAEATDAEAVIHSRLTRFDLDAGPITKKEVYLMAPYENGVGVAELTPQEIMRIMEEQHAKRNSYVACGLWGYRVRFNEQGRATGLFAANGEKVAGGKRISVAFNSYTLASGGGRFPILRKITRQPAANLQDTGLMTREVLEAYIRRHSPLKLWKPQP
ncbi:MAG: bifunctional UDP-sugar hydrolase/5'-nucleotidase [Lentisphaeria bacterium]